MPRGVAVILGAFALHLLTAGLWAWRAQEHYIDLVDRSFGDPRYRPRRPGPTRGLRGWKWRLLHEIQADPALETARQQALLRGYASIALFVVISVAGVLLLPAFS